MDDTGETDIRAVTDEQWDIVAWLWQAFRHDLAVIVDGRPYPDGRYQAGPLAAFPSPDGVGYLAWQPHPKTGEGAPVGFAVVDGLTRERRSVVGFWVTPAVRREGVGPRLAVDVLQRHPARGPSRSSTTTEAPAGSGARSRTRCSARTGGPSGSGPSPGSRTCRRTTSSRPSYGRWTDLPVTVRGCAARRRRPGSSCR